jgi:hypothetical protein
MGAGPDNEPLASPGDFFADRKRRVAELFAELLGRPFLPFANFAAVDHHIMRVALSLDLDLAKFDQSRFHFSMVFRQEIEMGLPARFTVGVQNQVEHFAGDTRDRSLTLEARYALANWNKLPLNPTISAEYRFGLSNTSQDSGEDRSPALARLSPLDRVGDEHLR